MLRAGFQGDGFLGQAQWGAQLGFPVDGDPGDRLDDQVEPGVDVTGRLIG
jgi:hypothetical protein